MNPSQIEPLLHPQLCYIPACAEILFHPLTKHFLLLHLDLRQEIFYTNSLYALGNKMQTSRYFLETLVQFSSQVVSETFATPWTAARQNSLSINNFRGLLKVMSIESVIPSNHLILCHPLLMLSIFPSIRVFSNESALRIRWPKYWNVNFNISPSNEYSGLISLGWTVWISLQSKGLSRVFSNIKVQNLQFFSAQLSLQSNSHPYKITEKTIAFTRQTLIGKVVSLLFNMLSRLVITFLPEVSIF